jgi:integrase/recombinase XerD
MKELLKKENNKKTIGEAIKEFLFHCQYEKNLDAKTIKAYNIDLKQFSEFIQETRVAYDIKSMRKEILKSYLQKISNFKPKTVKRKIASLKAMLNYLEYEDDNYTNPFRKIKVRFKEPYTLPTVMTIDEIRKIFQHFYKKRDKNEFKDKYTFKAQTRDIAVIELLFAIGIRVSELCSLKTNDINLKNGSIKVLGKGSKERIICKS